MENNYCECKESSIEEGIFGEYFPSENVKYTSSEITDEDANDSLKPITIKSYKLINKNRMEVTLITWGATIVSIKCPDKYGKIDDVVIGFDNLENYMNKNINEYIGSIIGRCANRIKAGKFTIDKKDYKLSLNDGDNHLHGGNKGLGRQIWDSFIDNCCVVMTYLSPDGEEGYPGDVLTTIKFKLTQQNKLEINIRATTSKPTVLNLTHGVLFNLAGHNAGEEELRKHCVSLNCDRWIFTDVNDPIPTGGIRGVGGTVMDLRIPKNLGDAMDKVPPAGIGFNHNYCVLKNWQPSLTFMARITHPDSGRVLEIYSDQPGLQFNTCSNFPLLKNDVDNDDDDDEDDTVTQISHEEVLDSKQFDELESYASYDGDEEAENFHSPSNLINNNFSQSDTETMQSTIKSLLPFIPGKNNSKYTKFCGFGIHPQNYPNAVNIKHFPCSILRPGQVYCHDLAFKFGIQLKNYM